MNVESNALGSVGVQRRESRIGDAASWVTDKAQDALQSAADLARERATAAVAVYTQRDPLRAVLIAAGAGAVLMAIVALMAKSGARKVERRVRR